MIFFPRQSKLAATALAMASVMPFALSCGSGAPDDAAPVASLDRPNVLVVLVDALRRDHVGAYGYHLPTTPWIDAFAAEGAVFERAYSHSSWTKPSVATLFTSVYPDQHGLGRVGFEDDEGFQTDVLPEQLETLAERFREGGYRTGSIGTNVHIQAKTGFAQGFDHFFNERLVTAYEVNGLLQEWLESGDQGAPFFAYAHYMDAHFPYNKKLENETGRFGQIRTEPPAPMHWTQVDKWAEKHLTPKNLAALVARYDREIAWVDGAFGELHAWLRETGRLKDTVVVVIADHGEGFNEHGELQHGYAPYTEVTAIPFVVRLPASFGLEPRRIVDVVGVVDVMPTLLDLAGLESPQVAQGRSLEPLLRGERIRERPVYLEGPGVRGLRSSTHTLLSPEDGEDECFDLRVDPGELSALDEPLPEICARMASALDGLVAQFALIAGDEGATVTLDESEVEDLRALGYLD